MALVLRQTTYNAIPPKDDTLTFGELDGNFIDLDQKIENLDTTKQATLVSGTNIKTIDGNSLLGSGDLDLGLTQTFIDTPTITSPASGTTNYNSFITSSAFSTSVDFGGTHTSSHWQAASDSGFTTLLSESTSGNLVSWLTGVSTPLTTVYVRVRYISDNHVSEWSNTIYYVTPNVTIVAPTLTVTGTPSSVTESPTLSGSAFSVTGGSDTHLNTDWEVRKVSDNSLVWSSYNSTTYKTSIVVPAATLSVSTAYLFRVRYRGTTYGASLWTEVSGTTLSSFVPTVAGTAYAGGFYAGRINIDGTTYAVVVASKALGGENSSLAYKTTDDDDPSATSTYNGMLNSTNINNAAHPAAQWCMALNIGGYDDWYLPAKNELEICYRYLKPSTEANDTSSGVNDYSVPTTTAYTSGSPSQTSVTIFQTGNTEAFSSGYYWSSTQYSSTYAWVQDFYGGFQGTYFFKNVTRWVRAIRKVAV